MAQIIAATTSHLIQRNIRIVGVVNATDRTRGHKSKPWTDVNETLTKYPPLYIGHYGQHFVPLCKNEDLESNAQISFVQLDKLSEDMRRLYHSGTGDVEIIAKDFFYAHCLPELQNNRFPDTMYHDIALRMVQKFGRFGYPNLKYWCQVDHEILIALFRTDGPMIANIDKRSQDDDDDNLHEALANPEVQNAALDGIWKDIEYLWGEKSNELIEWVRRIVLRRASSDPQNIMVKVRVIHEAAEHGLDWDQGMEELLSNRELLHFRNEITGLLPFMTFAADHQKAVRPHIKLPIQNKSIIKPIDTLYKMIRLNPNLVKYDCN